MRISHKALLGLSASTLIVAAPVMAQATSPSTVPPAQPVDQATTAPGSSGQAGSTTSPQGPAEVGQSASARTGNESQTGLQDIIVTAQQRGENLQKAAVAVAVVSGADLVNSNTRGIETLGKLVPSLIVSGGSQGNLIFIRGVGNFSYTANSDPATAYNFDGVYVARSSSSFGSFYDLERVEVLKGPQGTLYGRNATAGAINILPVQPKLGETSAYASASYGNYNAFIGEGAVNVGLGENAGLRLSATYAKHDPYLLSGTQTDDAGGVRAQLKVALTPDITLRIEGDYAWQRGVGSGSTYFGRFDLNPATGRYVATPSGLSLDQGLYTAAAQNYRTTNGAAFRTPTGAIARFEDPLADLPFRHNDVYGIAYHLDWRTALGTVSVIPAWRHGLKLNLSTDPGIEVGDRQVSNQYSVEARLVSNPGRLFDYILGAYYFTEEVTDDTHLSAGVQASFSQSRYNTHSPSGYGRLTLHATDWLRFTGGLRYTEDHKTFNSAANNLIEVCVLPTGCPGARLLPYTTTLAQQPVVPAMAGLPPAVLPTFIGGSPANGALIRLSPAGSGRLDTNKLTYRGAVEVDVGTHSLLYGSVETGYRAGGFNTTFAYGPENITAFTVGIKNRFLDNRLQLNVELFDWKYRGEQLSFLGIDPNGVTGVLTNNVGNSSIKGAEVEGRARVTSTTTLSANVQYLDSRLVHYSYQSPVSGGQPYSGCNVTPGATVYTVDCSGKPGINSPRWTINLGGDQVVPLGAYQVVLSADTQYRSSRYVGTEFIPAELIAPNWSTNAQVSIGAKDGRYVLGAFIRNIEGNRTPQFGTLVPGSNLIVVTPSAPRTYGLRLSGRF